MKPQNQVILSIGSNQGDRKQQLQNAIDMVHIEIGTVIKVSDLYETAAWGFEGDLFLNAVILIHSQVAPSKIMTKIIAVEKKLGRQRSTSKHYESRVIDIDVIAINQMIINTKTLIVPHPQLQNRRFVLQPMLDLNLDWVHPILNQNTETLLSNCCDNGSSTKIGKLVSPLSELQFFDFNYIAIEGNIGAGKTTLTNKIAEDFNAKTVLERFAENPFLPKFYKDQARFAFPLEMSFLADRYQQLTDDLAQFDLFKDFLIADYHIFKSLIFAKVTLAEDEFRLYKNLFDIIYKEMPKPDLYIYLYQNTARLLQNIKLRGRSYEQDIPAAYLDKINLGYLDYIKSQTTLNVLVIDVSDKDFVKNQADYVFVLSAIQKKLRG